jgi:hypothetical protein
MHVVNSSGQVTYLVHRSCLQNFRKIETWPGIFQELAKLLASDVNQDGKWQVVTISGVVNPTLCLIFMVPSFH